LPVASCRFPVDSARNFGFAGNRKPETDNRLRPDLNDLRIGHAVLLSDHKALHRRACDGKIRSREIYDNASEEQRWIEQIRQGGVFLMNGPANRQFPAASAGFLAALTVARPSMKRFTVAQQNGVPYAEIIEIER